MTEIFKQIDNLKNFYLDFLISICNIETNSNDKEAINELVDFIINAESDYIFERKSFKNAGDCLCLDFITNPSAPYISLSAHMDTVYKKGEFGYPPVKTDGDYIYGPGVSDCKGGIAIALLTMAALKKSGFNGANIRLLLQSDEEVSSSLSDKGTIDYICEKAKDSIAFLNLETKRKGKLTFERNGIINALFDIYGKATHSKDKELGINAINEAALKIAEIAAEKSGISYNCGIITGGKAHNIVPDKCSFEVEARFRTNADYINAMNFLKSLAEKSFIDGARTTLTILSDRPPMEITDKNKELFEKINAVSIKYGFGELEPLFSPGGSDASWTTLAGIPTMDSLGIIGEKYHSKDERAQISSLADSAKLLAAIIIELSNI